MWVWLAGSGPGSAGGWFFLSGLAGFGLGGLAMFHSLPRAGSNLSTLIVQCGSVVVALVVEWAWLGSAVPAGQLACIGVILGGVVLGLAPGGLPGLEPARLRLGAVLALVSAVGQGAGQVLSRKAFAVARAGGEAVDPGTATWERVLAGLVVAAVALAVVRFIARVRPGISDGRGQAEGGGASGRGRPLRGALPWVLLNTLTGPVLGVTCLQWALKHAHAGVVQAVVATAPLLTAAVAWRLGEGLPRPRYFAGAALAVAGTAALAWLRLAGGR